VFGTLSTSPARNVVPRLVRQGGGRVHHRVVDSPGVVVRVRPSVRNSDDEALRWEAMGIMAMRARVGGGRQGIPDVTLLNPVRTLTGSTTGLAD